MEQKITLKNVNVKEFTKFIKRVSMVNQSIQLKLNKQVLSAIAIPQTTNSFLKYVSMPVSKVATCTNDESVDIDLLNVNKLLTALQVSQDNNDMVSIDIVHKEGRSTRISIYNSMLKINIPCAMSNIIGVPMSKIKGLLSKEDNADTVFSLEASEMKRIKDLLTISNISDKVFIQMYDNKVYVSEIETDDGTQDMITNYIDNHMYQAFNEVEKVYSKTLTTVNIDAFKDDVHIYDKRSFAMIDEDPSYKFRLFSNMVRVDSADDSIETTTFITRKII